MRQLRNLRIPAALAAAAATVTLTAGAASASPTHHHPTGGSVTSSYSCTKEKIDGRYYENCTLNVVFTGPAGAWTMHIQTPRREKLTDFAWQVNDSSELGSTAPQTKYAPLTVTGYPDDYADGILPGQTATGWFSFDAPMGKPLPRVSIQLTQ